jgi:hypothetical protein
MSPKRGSASIAGNPLDVLASKFRKASVLVRKVSAQGRFHIAESIAFHTAKTSAQFPRQLHLQKFATVADRRYRRNWQLIFEPCKS